MTPEGRVKDMVKRVLKRNRCTWFMPVTRGFGTSGAPDLIVNARGLYLGIETKGAQSAAAPLQRVFIDTKICAVGGSACVVGSNALRWVRAFETHDASTPLLFEGLKEVEAELDIHIKNLINHRE